MNETHRKFLVKDFRSGVYIIAVCSLIGLLEPLIPLLDLFNHFRLQAVVGSIVLGIFLVWLKDRKVLMLALVVCIFNLGIIAYKMYELETIPSLEQVEEKNLTIISSNVLTSNEHYEKLIDMVQNQQPDVLVLSEVDELWINALKPLETNYKYILKHPRPDNFGLAAYSKKPFNGEIHSSGEAQLPIMVLEFDDVTLIGAHPLPPMSNRNMRENRKYLSDVSSLARKRDLPVILAGDLNSTIWSAAIKPLAEAGFAHVNPWGIAYTWPRNNPLLALQIDHFFGKNIKAADFEVLPSVGSDHFPIRADIAY